tara:strand:- start:2640 stop:4904 length:2265 start_codon:yes stop_codon:yes gene_type:complete
MNMLKKSMLSNWFFEEIEISEKSYSVESFNELILKVAEERLTGEPVSFSANEIDRIISLYLFKDDPIYVQLLAFESLLSLNVNLIELCYFKLPDITARIIFVNSLNYIKTTLKSRRLALAPSKKIGNEIDVVAESIFFECVSQLLPLINLNPVKKVTGRKVTITLNIISPIKNQTGTKLYLDYAVALIKSEDIDKVTILITYEETIGQARQFNFFSWRNRKFNILEKITSEYELTEEQINKIIILDKLRNSSSSDYIKDLLSFEELFEDNIIIFFEYKFSVILKALTDIMPSVYVPIQIGLSPQGIRPSVECWMSHDKRNRAFKSNIFDIEKQISYDLPDFGGYDFKYRDSPSQLIFVTAAYELHKRVDQHSMTAFLAVITEALLLSPTAKFIFLGIEKNTGESLLKLHSAFIDFSESVRKRIIFIKSEENFRGFLRNCDIFLMPRHKGGGRSIRTALAEGLAVHTFDQNDGNLYMPKQNVHSTNEEFKRTVLEITTNPASLVKSKNDCKAYYSKIDINQTIQRFLGALSQAREAITKQLILVAGDSHTRAIHHISWPDDTNVDYVHVDGITLSGLHNPQSKTNGFKKLRSAIRSATYDKIVLNLGEVDVGYLIWFYHEKRGVKIYDALDRAVSNYLFLIVEALKSTSNLAIISTPLPTVDSYADVDNEIFKARSSIKASLKARTELTLEFNSKIKSLCKDQIGVEYIDLDTASLDKDGFVKAALKNKDPHDHHYNPVEYANLLSANMGIANEK